MRRRAARGYRMRARHRFGRSLQSRTVPRRRWASLRLGIAAVVATAGLVSVGVTAASAAGTSISASPNTGLLDGQVVAVSGSGWRPGGAIYFCEGVLSALPGPADCNNSQLFSAFADGSGNLTASLTVTSRINVPSAGGAVDCIVDTRCVVGATDPTDVIGTITSTPLRFLAVPTVVPGGGFVAEGNSGTTDLHVALTLSKPFDQPVAVDWDTIFVTGASDIQATPGTDYTPASGTVTFAPGATAATITISVKGDTTVEPDKWIVVSFHKPANARIGGYWGLGFGIIVNDD